MFECMLRHVGNVEYVLVLKGGRVLFSKPAGIGRLHKVSELIRQTCILSDFAYQP